MSNDFVPNPETEIAAYASVAKKDTNPKDAVGVRKVSFSMLCWPVLANVALAMLEGARKYGRHNYRVIGVRASVYFDAAGRHLTAWWEGQDLDPDSKIGLHHLDKAIASLMVVRDAMLRGNWTDDRPPRTDDGWLTDANRLAEALIDQFPNPVAPYTQTARAAELDSEHNMQTTGPLPANAIDLRGKFP